MGESVYVAASADVIGDVELADNSSVWFQCVLRGDIEPIRVGENSNIQDGTVIHTMKGAPTIVGKGVQWVIRPCCMGATSATIASIGMGAVLMNHVQVGEGSIVAAGALVAENTVIPPRSLYMGVPARLKRAVTDEEFDMIKRHETNYLRYKIDYLAKKA